MTTVNDRSNRRLMRRRPTIDFLIGRWGSPIRERGGCWEGCFIAVCVSVICLVLQPPARYNGEPWRRSRITLAQIRRSCLYFCERQAPLFVFIPSHPLNTFGDPWLHCRRFLSREAVLTTVFGIRSYELAIQLRAGSAVMDDCII